MTILSRDIFSTPAAEILDARVAATVIAGQFVFREGI
jgi:predicted amidohydrolase YtcJ